jgi:hypothetical protein
LTSAWLRQARLRQSRLSLLLSQEWIDHHGSFLFRLRLFDLLPKLRPFGRRLVQKLSQKDLLFVQLLSFRFYLLLEDLLLDQELLLLGFKALLKLLQLWIERRLHNSTGLVAIHHVTLIYKRRMIENII